MKRQSLTRIVKTVAGMSLAVLIFAGNVLDVFAANVTIKEDSVRVRQSATTDSTQLGSVKKGSCYDVLETTSDASGKAWYKITFDGTNTGYIRADMTVDSTSSEAANLKANPTATPTPTPAATATPAPTATPTAAPTPTVDTSIAVAASTQVESVNPVAATVSNNTVNVRAEASADSGKVTTVNKNTAVTINGQANGADGKVWYLTSFSYLGQDVQGFIRSDFLSVSGEVTPAVVEEPVEEEPIVEEPTEPEAPAIPQDYELKYETDTEGNYQWYIYDNTQGKRSKLTTILEAAEAYSSADQSDSFGGKSKIIIIVMAIVLVIMALAITLLIFKVRDLEYNDDEDYDSYSKAPAREPRSVRPAGAGQPRPQGQPRPAGAGQPRPAGQGQPRPAGAGQPRPAGQGQPRPAGAGQPRPAGAGQPRPAGQGQPRPAGQGQPRPQGQPQPRPVKRDPDYIEPENPKAPVDGGDWKPKNIAADNDEFEFEFLNNWDSDDK